MVSSAVEATVSPPRSHTMLGLSLHLSTKSNAHPLSYRRAGPGAGRGSSDGKRVTQPCLSKRGGVAERGKAASASS